ncbi:Protein transport protein S9 plasma membrane t-SNARE, partial [Coemansia sp. RSA 2322]
MSSYSKAPAGGGSYGTPGRTSNSAPDRVPSSRGSDGRDRVPSSRGSDGRDRAPSSRGSDGRDRAPSSRGSDGRDRVPSSRGSDGRDRAPSSRGSGDRVRMPSGTSSPANRIPNGGGVRGYASAARESRSQYGAGSSTNYRQGQHQYANEEDDDEDVDTIKSRITQVKKDTLDSTRNSLRTLEQTEKVGTATLEKLGQQSEQLNRIDRTLEMTNIQAENSIEDTSKLRTLNKSIFH